MNLQQIIIREIRFRRSWFLVSVLSVVAAVAVMVGAAASVSARRQNAQHIVAERRQGTALEMDRMQDDYRRFMKDMGYNSIIIHEDQDTTALVRWGQPDTWMPEAYVHTLAHAPRASYNHLLPVLRKRMHWPERDVEIIVSGTSGQVPVQAKPRFWTEEDGYIDPIRADIPPGTVEIGHALAQELDISAGDALMLMGERFVVHRVIPEQGDLEDITVWCALDRVQHWLGKPGRINAIFALECMGSAPALGGIVQHVPTILPDTQVLQLRSLVDTRLDARGRASLAHSAAMASEETHRGLIATEYGAFAAILVPVVLVGSGFWLFWLFLDNVRCRRSEIGILRAIGVRRSTITAMFMLKATMTGVLAALPGYLLGVLAGTLVGGAGLLSGDFFPWRGILWFFAAMLVAPALCALAGWLPARWASEQDPVNLLADG